MTNPTSLVTEIPVAGREPNKPARASLRAAPDPALTDVPRRAHLAFLGQAT
jgi:hypothetical protein